MKTYIYYTAKDNSYTQGIDCTNDAETAREYIDGCNMSNNEYWCEEDIGALITAKVYRNNDDPMFDDAVQTTCEMIKESDLQ